MRGSITIRDIEPSHAEWARNFLMEQFGSTRVVTRGVMHQADALPRLIAVYERRSPLAGVSALIYIRSISGIHSLLKFAIRASLIAASLIGITAGETG